MTVYKAQTVVTNYLDVSTSAPSNPVDGQKWMDGTIMKTWDETKKEWVAEDLKGEVGDAGTGVKDTTIMYSVSTSGTVQPTSGWQSTIPTVPTGSFLWSRTVWTYTDGTSKTGYTVSKIGEDGKTMYVHKAWSWSSDGTDRFTDKYPNENLIVRKDEIKDKYLGVDGTPTNNSNCCIMKDVISVSTGEILNFQKTDTSEYFRCNWIKPDGSLHSRFARNENGFDVIVPFGVNFIWISYPKTGNNKVEKSSESTVYTPSPKDDFDNAWPKYEGYYSSHSPVQSTNPPDYTWSVIRGENGKDGTDGKNGTDGQDGVTPKDVISGYLTNESLIVPANPSGVVSSYANAYGDFVVYEGQTKLNSGVTYTKVSETGMTSTINSAGRYTMTALTTDTAMAIYRATYSGVSIDKIVIAVKNKQGATGSTGPAGTNGKDGATGPQGPPTGVTTQATVPTGPYVGMLWLNTGTIAGYVTGATYKWDGSKWGFYILRAENIVADSLSAISANLGNITAGKLTGTDIVTYINRVGGDVYRKGYLRIYDGIIDLNYEDFRKSDNLLLARKGYTMTEDGFEALEESPEGSTVKLTSYTTDGVYMEDANFTYGKVDLSYQDLIEIPTVRLEAAPDWEVYATTGASEPTGERYFRTVTLTGAFKPTKNLPVTTVSDSYVIGYVPVGLRPRKTKSIVNVGSGIRLFQLAVNPDGTIVASRNRDNNGYTDFLAGGWYSISVDYPAGDI